MKKIFSILLVMLLLISLPSEVEAKGNDGEDGFSSFPYGTSKKELGNEDGSVYYGNPPKKSSRY